MTWPVVVPRLLGRGRQHHNGGWQRVSLHCSSCAGAATVACSCAGGVRIQREFQRCERLRLRLWTIGILNTGVVGGWVCATYGSNVVTMSRRTSTFTVGLLRPVATTTVIEIRWCLESGGRIGFRSSASTSTGSTYTSVSLCVVCIRCVMYLSCLSTLSVKWSTFASNARIHDPNKGNLCWCGGWTRETAFVPRLQRRHQVNDTAILPELYGAIHPPTFLFRFPSFDSDQKVVVKMFDVLLLLFNYCFYCIRGKNFMYIRSSSLAVLS